MVSRHIRAPEGCPGKYFHRNGSRSHMGTEIMPGHTSAQDGCLGKYGHRNSAWANVGTRWVQGHMLMCTRIVPGHIWANIGKCAQANIGT